MPSDEIVCLRPVDECDFELVLQWRNSDRIRKNMFSDHQFSRDEHKIWFEKIKKEEIPTFMIFCYQNRPVGAVTISNLDKQNNKCNWGFYLGEPGLPKGCGFSMGYLWLEYLFETFKFRKVSGEVFANNSVSLKFHKKFGFVEEGRLLHHVLKDGIYEDVVVLALLDQKWHQMKPQLKQYRLSYSPSIQDRNVD